MFRRAMESIYTFSFFSETKIDRKRNKKSREITIFTARS